MMTLEEIRSALKDRRTGIVAKAIGVRIGTVTDIRNGVTKNPSYSVIKALSDYLSPPVGGA